MVKINFKEYEKMVAELSLNRSKYVIVSGTVLTILLGFFANFILDRDLISSIVSGILAGIIFYFAFRAIISSSAKKINCLNKVVGVEQEILEDRIIERVIKEEDSVNEGIYYYKDIIVLKEDKNNFYLYINKNAAVIVNKDKVEELEKFKLVLRNHKLLK